jgi:hypothetical protein
MKNRTKFSIAVAVTLLIAIIYAILLAKFGAPKETSFVLLDKKLFSANIETPVSYWWSMLAFVPVLLALAVMLNYSERYSENESTEEESNKTHARAAIYVNNSASLAISAGSTLLWLVVGGISIAFGHPVGYDGPISSMTSFACIYLVLYVAFGTFSEFAEFTFRSKWMDNRSNMDLFLGRLNSYLEIGFTKTLPMIVGLIFGLITRSIADTIVGAIKGAVSSTRKTTAAL